ncbi:MAG: DUF6531 domain-containing protein, partial [Anaerolineae bacterium]|nr:DUF6531 domain-containing protein [Anaerolineae bacterium]
MTARSRVMQVQAYFPDMPYSPNIYPEGYWRKTGMRVFTGEKLRIEATGTIGWPAPPMGPDGDVDNEFAIHSSQGDLLWERTPRVPFLKLIGRIGTSNTNRFEIGAAYNGIATASGELYLAINDRVRYFYDNNGAFEVTINIGMDAPEDEGESDPPFNYSGDDDETSCHPISLRKGEKREQVIDLRLNTSVGSLDFIRYYRQSKQADTTFQFMGLGWTHNHDIVLNAAGLPDVIDVLTANGGMTRFRQSLTDPGLYEGVAGSNSRIEVDSGSTDARYLLTAEDYSLYVFDSQGRLRCKEWLSGDVWTYSYDVSELYTGKPKLLSIEDNDGHSLSFAYGNPDNEYAHPLLIHVEDHTGRQVNFSYSPEKEDGVVIGTFGSRQALLTGVEDVRQQDWRYVYYGAAAGEDESSLFNLLLEVHSPPVDTDGDGSTDSLLLLKRLHYSFETDLAVNGGMETDSDWWLIPGLEASINEQVMTEADTGSASRHMSANDGRGIEGQPWNLVQGRTYTLRARVRQVSGTLKMQVNQLTTFSAQSVNTSGWQTLETTYTHAGDIMEGCRLQFIAEGGSAEFYVDTVSILETTPEISIITQERGLSKTLSNGVVSNPLARETLQLEPGGDPITLETDAAGK